MKNKILIFSVFIFLFFLSKLVFAQREVIIYFFELQGCPHCAAEKVFLEKLKEKYPQLIVKEFELSNSPENQALFTQTAKAYNTKAEGVPMTFIGKNYVLGFDTEEIKGKEIEKLIEECFNVYCPSPVEILAVGGINNWNLPEINYSSSTTSSEKDRETKIYLHYFVKNDCFECEELIGFLKEAIKKYSVEFKIYNISEDEESKVLYQKLKKIYEIPTDEFPVVFLGKSYLVGPTSIKENIENLILSCQKEDCSSIVDEIKNTIVRDEEKVIKIPFFGKEIKISSHSSLFFLGMILGLADGINPCMFSVLLFLLTYLLTIGSRQRAIKIGIVFTVVVFLVYFLFMYGMINLILLIGAIKKIKIIVGFFALIVSLILIKDFFVYGKWFSLEIPEKTKPLIEYLVKKATVPSAILLAILSSLVELPCTVGIPLVYTSLLAEKSANHIFYLLWYNLFFVAPLFIIIAGFAFTFYQIDRLEKWRLNFRRYMRLVAGLILLFLSISLLRGWL